MASRIVDFDFLQTFLALLGVSRFIVAGASLVLVNVHIIRSKLAPFFTKSLSASSSIQSQPINPDHFSKVFLLSVVSR